MPAVSDTDMPAVSDTDMPAVSHTDMPAVSDTDMPAVSDTDMPAVSDLHPVDLCLHGPDLGLPHVRVHRLPHLPCQLDLLLPQLGLSPGGRGVGKQWCYQQLSNLQDKVFNMHTKINCIVPIPSFVPRHIFTISMHLGTRLYAFHTCD